MGKKCISKVVYIVQFGVKLRFIAPDNVYRLMVHSVQNYLRTKNT